MSGWPFHASNAFEFTAMIGADVLTGDDDNLNSGDSFVMGFSASASVTVTDNDGGLSGDAWNNENGDDRTGQIADVAVDGALVHEDVKIYAEQVYILQGDDGRLYYLVEIEIAEVGQTDLDDFYAFTGDVPPAGVELTVVGQFNVYGQWLKYRDLSGGLVWDLDASGAVTIEAEDMALSNYRADDIDAASGGEVIKLKANEGEASVVFGAASGRYDMTVAYVDESDGEGAIEVLVNGVLVAEIALDQNGDGDGGDGSSISSLTIAGLDIAQGDTVVLRGSRDGAEFARIDAVTFQANQAPDAQDDVLSVQEGGALSADLLANDSDPNGDPIAVVEAGGVAPGVPFDIVTADGRTVQATVSAAGVLDVVAAESTFERLALGQSDSFTVAYRIGDGEGNFDDATATVSVVGENDGPVVSGPILRTAGEDDAGFGVDLLANASDVDAGAILAVANLVLLEGDASGVSVGGGSLAVDTAAYGFLGDGESEVIRYSYDVVDEHGAAAAQTAEIVIVGANDPPTAPDQTFDGDEDAVVTAQIVADDPDGGDGLTFILQSQVLNGAIALNPDGSFTYTPNADFNGEDSFTYLVRDSLGVEAVGTVTLAIAPINDDPVGDDIQISVDPDTPFAGQLTATDVDGDVLAFAAGDAPANGAVVIDGDGGFTYTPDAGFSGDDSFTYVVDDGQGGVDTGVVSVSVEEPNLPPVAVDIVGIEGRENAVITGQIVAEDPNVGDVLTYARNTNGAGGIVAVEADGSFTYTPRPNRDFSGPDSFQYIVTDQDGASDIGTVFLTVIPVHEGTTGDDVLVGGDVKDVLIGLAGDDTLTGGAGEDVFEFAFGEAGADQITDFEAGLGAGDAIQLNGFGVTEIGQLAIGSNGAGGSLITLSDGGSIELLGVAETALVEDDFSFA